MLYSIWLSLTGHEKCPLVSKDLQITQIWPRGSLTARGLPCPFPPPALTSLIRFPLLLPPSPFCYPGCLQRSLRVLSCTLPLPGHLPRAEHMAPLTFNTELFLALLLPHLKMGGYCVPPTSFSHQGFLLFFFPAVALLFQVQRWLLTPPTLVYFNHPSSPLAGCKRLLPAFF